MVSSNVRIGDLCVFRRVDCEKVLLGRVIQFSYLGDTKKQRGYSSTYVDMWKNSYKEIGVFANYFARFEGTDDVERVIQFQPLNLIFTAGYLSTDHYIGTVDEAFVAASDRTDTTFVIPISAIRQIVPQWKDLLSLSTEFVTA